MLHRLLAGRHAGTPTTTYSHLLPPPTTTSYSPTPPPYSQSYELCADMIDVVIDVSSIYGLSEEEPPGASAMAAADSNCVITLSNGTALYLRCDTGRLLSRRTAVEGTGGGCCGAAAKATDGISRDGISVGPRAAAASPVFAEKRAARSLWSASSRTRCCSSRASWSITSPASATLSSTCFTCARRSTSSEAALKAAPRAFPLYPSGRMPALSPRLGVPRASSQTVT